MALEDISEDDFREKDRLVHQEFNRVYRDIFNSKYAKKLLLSENEPPEDSLRAMQSLREI